MKKTISLLTVLLCGATYLTQAGAQDLGGALDLPMLGRSLTLSASMRAQAQRDAARLHGRPSGTRPSQTRPHVARGSTRFAPSAAVRQRLLARFVAKVRAADPQNAAKLQQSFSKGDPIAAIAPALRRYNLDTNDVADATTAYLVSAWYGVRGSNDDPPRAYITGVRNQIREVMLSNSTFLSASNATKQEMADGLLVNLMLNDALISAAKGNPAKMAKVKAAIGQGVRTNLQLDLAKLKLTGQGLRS